MGKKTEMTGCTGALLPIRQGVHQAETHHSKSQVRMVIKCYTYKS